MLPDDDLPGPLPAPPSDLPQRALPIREVTGPWVRSHASAYSALYFGRSGRNRFDAPAQEFGILYVAEDALGAFAETFLDVLGLSFLRTAQLQNRSLARITANRALRLVDVTGAGLARIGADNRLSTGHYSAAHRWALALYEHPEQPDGLLYRSRHDPDRRCAAIFDRAADALTEMSMGSLADPHNATLLAQILDTYRLGLVD